MTATVPDHGAHATIEATEVRRILEAGRPARPLDVRTPGEFAAGHIEGSVMGPMLAKLPYNRGSSCTVDSAVAGLRT